MSLSANGHDNLNAFKGIALGVILGLLTLALILWRWLR